MIKNQIHNLFKRITHFQKCHEDLSRYDFSRSMSTFWDRRTMSHKLYDVYAIARDSSKRLSDDVVQKIEKLVLKSNLLVKPKEGYEDEGYFLRGKIVHFNTMKQEEYFYLSLRTREVSNDHYVFYELLIDRNSKNEFNLLKSQKYFYDDAGYEGQEYLAFAGLLEFIVLLGSLLIILMFNIIRYLLKKKQRGKFD